jgi:hypothetical protein
MKLFLRSAAILCCMLPLVCVAEQTTPSYNRIAIQAAMATGGLLGIGVVDYTQQTEIGATLSGTYNNASNQTKTITPVIFGGLRHCLSENTYFAYGIDLAGTYGKDNGAHIESDYGIGPYISLEQMLTHHVMLAGWIQPYQYQYVKKDNVSVSTNSYFASGGLAINYLF